LERQKNLFKQKLGNKKIFLLKLSKKGLKEKFCQILKKKKAAANVTNEKIFQET